MTTKADARARAEWAQGECHCHGDVRRRHHDPKACYVCARAILVRVGKVGADEIMDVTYHIRERVGKKRVAGRKYLPLCGATATEADVPWGVTAINVQPVYPATDVQPSTSGGVRYVVCGECLAIRSTQPTPFVPR